MSRLARIALIVLGAILVLVLVGAVALTTTVRRPFPKTEGRVTAQGLQDDVQIYRDSFGIPHIYAQNQEDLLFAQGYTHAQDRFWQMEFWRHVGQGRISEIVGEATLDSDKYIRTMGWHRMAENTLRYYQEQQPQYVAMLEAYAAGVNTYIEEHREELSINRTILGLVNEPWEIEPWTPLNTISWAVVMSNDLGGNWREELNRAKLVDAVGEQAAAELMPLYPYDSRPVIVPTSSMPYLSQASQRPALDGAVDWDNVNTDIVGQIPANGFALGRGEFVGSNNWAVSGQHTASGQPLLANDPHLSIQIPSIWYEVGLHAPGWNVVGFSFAGVPGVIIGHNDKIAWGVTNTGPDVQDLYVEKINPANPLQYEFEGEWRDMQVVQEVIKVNGGEDVVLDVRLTQHGPIINDVVDGLSDVLALRWTAQEPSRVLQSVILLDQAQNFDDFRKALEYWDVPSQNFVYADTEGNIGYQMPGLVPIRQKGDGLLPVPGWTGEYEWNGWVPYDELPRLYNPPEGYIVTANHAVVDPQYPHMIELKWDNGDRGQRIDDMIKEAIAQGKVTAEDFARIHFDSKSLLAESYLPLLASLSSSDGKVQAAIDRLAAWDLQERRDSVGAALFEIFFMHLTQAVLADELGADNVTSDKVFFHQLAQQPGAAWWDDTSTSGRETRDEILLKALASAVGWFEQNLGGDIDDWTWGRIHTATFVSAPLGQSDIGPIESLVNRGPFPADGGSSIVNANGWRFDNPAEVTGHPSMRMIVDMSNFDASQAVIPTGQSGHPLNPHYDDMIELWLNGQYHPMLFSQPAVEQAAEDRLTLRPAP